MTSQQAIFTNTILCMKNAIKRKAYDADSDTSIDKYTNRGNKLRKKARFVREGQLAPPTAPQVYRRTIEHGGYHRDILSPKPPLVDEDGYEIDSEDDDDRTQAALAAAAQFNPYAHIKLEQLLAPLTAASELPNHPTLSKPFTSEVLTNLTLEARDILQKEKTFLWKLKHLMTRMIGDNTWIPCHLVEGDNDWALFFEEKSQIQGTMKERENQTEENYRVTASGMLIGAEQHSSNSIIAAVKHLIAKEQQDRNGTDMKGFNIVLPDTQTRPVEKETSKTESSSSTSVLNNEDNHIFPTTAKTKLKEHVENDEVYENKQHTSVHHHMRTRAQAQINNDNATNISKSTSSDSDTTSFIHPYFLAAKSSRPDRNLGLPQNEASETRRVLQLYIQKQEEVCRGVQKIYDGLLKADRWRKLIMKWAKADGHVGVNRDMSDGEDWYDNEEWNLDEDLKKGQDEEEDAATAAKKTRTRRQ
ncbi:hypothetical protein Golomagni_03717 [Golovinomyces magnicellulatus]|nr:hypothetical protein Golomagni_03717 [Golovinomyces magnicellulatus]